jgi:hypothetical protein
LGQPKFGPSDPIGIAVFYIVARGAELQKLTPENIDELLVALLVGPTTR